MVLHVVLFSPRGGVPPDTPAALLQTLHAAIQKIPSVRRCHVGQRVLHGREYEQMMPLDLQFAAVLGFDDVERLKQYLNHPAHEELGTRFMASAEPVLVYDYEVRELTMRSSNAK